MVRQHGGKDLHDALGQLAQPSFDPPQLQLCQGPPQGVSQEHAGGACLHHHIHPRRLLTGHQNSEKWSIEVAVCTKTVKNGALNELFAPKTVKNGALR